MLKRWSIVLLSAAIQNLTSPGSCLAGKKNENSEALLDWTRIVDLPQPVSGPLVGNCGGSLVVAGGASFLHPSWKEE